MFLQISLPYLTNYSTMTPNEGKNVWADVHHCTYCTIAYHCGIGIYYLRDSQGSGFFQTEEKRGGGGEKEREKKGKKKRVEGWER